MSESLRAEPSPTISTINLVISIVSFLITLPTLLPQPLPRKVITLLRLLHTLLLLSPIALSLYTFSELLNDPLVSLSTPSANDNLFKLLNLTATNFDSTTGVSRFLIRPHTGDVDSSVIPHLTIVFMTVLAGCVISFRRSFVKRQASILAFGISTAYVLGALLTAFQPGNLRRDSSILQATWLDERFKDIGGVNETRFLSNFWIRDIVDPSDKESVNDKMDARNVLNVDGFHDSFCETFNNLPVQKDLVVDVVEEEDLAITRPPRTSAAASTTTTGTTTTTEEEEEEQEEEEDTTEEDDAPAPGSEEDRPQPNVRQAVPLARQSKDELVITRNLLSQILVVYTIGKPLFTTYGKSLSLLSLPFMTLTPVFIAYATRSRVLYPFIVGWVGLLLLLIVYATPETLRWVGVGFESSHLMTFCGRRYQVFVTDDVSYRIGVFDMVSFGFIVVTGVLQGFRWMRVREEENEGEAKMMEYGEVYSENGALRW